MELQTLAVKFRESVGDGPSRRLRVDGALPAVLYGGGGEPVSLIVDRKVFEGVLHGPGGEHALVKIEVEGKPELASPALVKAVQHHPVRGDITHADFLRIRLDEKIQTLVPLVLTGRSKGVQDGGIIDHQLRELEVECFALEAPDQIDVDITELGVGDSLHVGGLTIPGNVTVLTEEDRAVVTILAPRVAAESEETEEVPAADEVKEVGED